MALFNFKSRKKLVDAAPFIRRVVDLTAPGRLVQCESRTETRHYRALDIAFCPFVADVIHSELTNIGFTRDVSDRGLSFVSTVNLNCPEIILCILVTKEISETPIYFRGAIRRCRELPSHMVEYGIELVEYIDSHHNPDVRAVGQWAIESMNALKPSQ